MTNELQTIDRDHLPQTAASVEAVSRRLEMIRDLMRKTMEQGVDFGIVPGTNSKPTLLKPGAEKLAVLFQLGLHFDTEKSWLPGGHLMVESKCRVHDLQDRFLGEASAICTTQESKYAWRRQERTCPECGKASIIKGKEEYGGGWLCWRKHKEGGCGKQFPIDDTRIASQVTGRVPNPDLPDVFNTVLRIGEKRAMIGAIRMVTGASSLFDEEMPAVEDDEVRGRPAPMQEHAEDPDSNDKWSTDPTAWAKFIANPETLIESFNAAFADAGIAKHGCPPPVRAAINEASSKRGWAFDRGKTVWVLANFKGEPIKSEATDRISADQCMELGKLILKAGLGDSFCEEYAIKSVGDLPAIHYASATARLQGFIADKAKVKA